MRHDDPTDIRRDDERARRRDERRVREEEQVLERYRLLMGQAWGRSLVFEELEFTGVFRTSYTGNSETFFREGMRNVGLRLLNRVMQACPDQFIVMMQEHRTPNDRPDHDTANRAAS